MSVPGMERMAYAANGAPLIGGPMLVHKADRCAGGRCCLHNPDDHHMARWPLVLRASGLMERLCTHGVGHPDPDSERWLIRETGETGYGVHGCDGCCTDPRKPALV